MTAPVSQSGFFIADMPLQGTLCDWGTWTPSFTVLDANGKPLSTASETILPGAQWYSVDRGRVCGAIAKGPFGPASGQLQPDS